MNDPQISAAGVILTLALVALVIWIRSRYP